MLTRLSHFCGERDPFPGSGPAERFIDASRRIADRTVISALGWRGGDRLTLTADVGVATARRAPCSMITLPARPDRVRLPAGSA